MKKILFIMGLLLVTLLFIPDEQINSESNAMVEREAIMKEKNAAEEMQHRIEKISKDMRGSNFLTPRRHVQSTYYSPHIRVIRSAERIIQDIRLKGADRLQKVTEYESLRQTINYSALLRRLGYHVYALRKIVI